MSLHHAIVAIGKALRPGAVEQLGLVRGKVILRVEHVQALYDDWRRLDSEVRCLHAARDKKREQED